METKHHKYATHIFHGSSFVFQNKHLFFYAARAGRGLNVHWIRSPVRMFVGESLYLHDERRTTH